MMGEVAGSLSSIKAGTFECLRDRKPSAVFIRSWIGQCLRYCLLASQLCLSHSFFDTAETINTIILNSLLFWLGWLCLRISNNPGWSGTFYIAKFGLISSLSCLYYTSAINTVRFNKICFKVVVAKKSQEEEWLKTIFAKLFSGPPLCAGCPHTLPGLAGATHCLANSTSYEAFSRKLDF